MEYQTRFNGLRRHNTMIVANQWHRDKLIVSWKGWFLKWMVFYFNFKSSCLWTWRQLIFWSQQFLQ